jgi:hypothetical protein
MKKRRILSLTDQALQALRNAVARVVEDHRRRNIPLAIWRDGKAVLIPAKDVATLNETSAPRGKKNKN